MSPWNPLGGRSCKASPGKTSMGEHLRTLRGKLDRIHIKLVERDQENQSVRLALRTLRAKLARIHIKLIELDQEMQWIQLALMFRAFAEYEAVARQLSAEVVRVGHGEDAAGQQAVLQGEKARANAVHARHHDRHSWTTPEQI